MLRRALPLVVAILLSWVPYRAFLGDEVPVGRDLPYYFYPLKAHLAEAVRAGEVPWLDRYRWGGSPLLGSPGAAAFDPLNVLFVLLPVGAAMKAWILIRVAAGVAGFALFARRRGLSPEASAVAGLLFGLSGPFLSYSPFLGHHAAFSLLPWFALAAERALERPVPGRVVPLAFVSALLVVSGAPEFLLYAAIVALVLLPAGVRRDAAVRQAAALAGAALLAAALAAPAVVSGLRTVERSVRGAWGEISPETAGFKSLPLARLPELAWDGVVADWRTSGGLPERGVPYPYLPSVTPGRAAILLGVAGLLAGRQALAPASLSLLGLLLALGPATPVWPACARLFPPLLSVRYPEKHLALWGFGALWLAALGLARIARRLPESRQRLAAASLAAVVLLDREAIARGLMRVGRPEALRPPLLDRLGAPVPDAPPLRVFALWEYRATTRARPGIEEIHRLYREALKPELASLHGHGYALEGDLDLLMPRQNVEWLRFLKRAAPAGSPLVPRLLRTVGVTHVVDIEVGTERPRLHPMDDPLPPYRFARRLVADPDGQALLGKALEEGFEPGTAYVSDPPTGLPDPLPEGRVLSVHDRADALSLSVDAPGPSPSFLLVYRRLDAIEEATLDGEPVEVTDVLFGFGGVVVPPGRHEVRLRPDTAAVRLGALVTLSALPLLAALAAVGRWRKGTPED
ncbi:MAG: hypothetical protein EDX89_09905 [Acidobacteria bacterium]|nr:MAG: hypothetical protein EDX89_09905 [Acidobacteriota bacterium]